VDGVFYFAPEVKALLAIDGVGKRADHSALATFMASGHLLADQTLLQGVKRLEGGSYLKIAQSISSHRYWRFRPGTASSVDADRDLQEELATLLEGAALRSIRDPRSTAVFLSGGVDSRGVLGAARAAIGGDPTDLRAITWGANPDVPLADAVIARELASRFRFEHRFFKKDIGSYRSGFRKINRFLDWLSDVGAYQPHEFDVMLRLLQINVHLGLRGDNAFGWGIAVNDLNGARSEVGARRLSEADHLASILSPSVYRDWCERSDHLIDQLMRDVDSDDPIDAKDRWYFEHRLQRYLSTATYYKQLAIDHRNILLDDRILDFLAKVPSRLRVEKKLFRRVVLHRYPDLCEVPFATRTVGEDWGALLGRDSPVRRFAQAELDDMSSGIWSLFDRAAVRRLLDRTTQADPFVVWGPGLYRARMFLRNRYFALAPRSAARVRCWRRLRLLPAHAAVLRVLVLKNWYDTQCHRFR
jgi:asparagine synthetase B (glutamine-hydrolysing)